MIAYLDASVILRIVFHEQGPLAEWDLLTEGVTSTVTRVECFRTLSRSFNRKRITPEEHLHAAFEIDAILWRVRTIALTRRILDIASQSWTFDAGALDAIHLATAMVFREQQPSDEPPVVFATHDRELAAAADATKFRVIGAAA